MGHCVLDSQLKRVVMNGMSFPLGVYPVQSADVRQGYAVEFESSDGGEAERDDVEEWPDRYAFDVVITAERLEALTGALLALMPPRIYPILDVMGTDAYREIDPYVSYELVGLDRFLDSLRQYKAYLLEDGTCGFGAMSLDPFFYFFVDVHKVVSVRVAPEGRERVERLLAAFDLEHAEHAAGADGADHEHRGVLVRPENDPGALTPEEILERLEEEWRLTLNVDPRTNVDDEGRELGTTFWRVTNRVANKDRSTTRIAFAILAADCHADAAELGTRAAADLAAPEPLDPSTLAAAIRMTPEEAGKALGEPEAPKPERGRIYLGGWLE
jgi:hypothetical protein